MKNNLLVIIFIVIIFLYMNKNNIEKMTNILQTDIDIDSIKTLTEVARKLQEEGLTIPGNLKVIGDLSVDKNFNYLPRGSIIAYNGNQAPPGWAICNGQKIGDYQTPDLTGKFIIGSKNENNFKTGDSGGSKKITRGNLPNFEISTNNDGSHRHKLPYAYINNNRSNYTSTGQEMYAENNKVASFGPIAAPGHSIGVNGRYSKIEGQMVTDSSHSHKIAFTGGNTDYYQPYYALTYIVKL